MSCYLKSGTGNAWAGHCKAYDSFFKTSNMVPVKTVANLGGTLPTGSTRKGTSSLISSLFTWTVGPGKPALGIVVRRRRSRGSQTSSPLGSSTTSVARGLPALENEVSSMKRDERDLTGKVVRGMLAQDRAERGRRSRRIGSRWWSARSRTLGRRVPPVLRMLGEGSERSPCPSTR